MKVNFLLLITLSIAVTACNDKGNKAKGFCFFDASILHEELKLNGYPAYAEEMKNALPMVWNVSTLNDECENIPYVPTPLITSMLYIHVSEYTENRAGLQLLIDTTRSFSMSLNKRLMPVDLQIYKQDVDSLVNVQLDSNRMNINLFHILNSDNHDILLQTQDGIPMVIQEALDSNGIWRPIEYWWYAWCGNAYNDNTLKPDTYITFGTIKYTGEHETQLRLKLKNKYTTIYSSPYKGKINLEQFDLLEKHQKLEEDRKDNLFFRPRKYVY